jgi:hypothetical protein
MEFTTKMMMMAAYATAISLKQTDYNYGYNGTVVLGSTLNTTGDIVCDARLD